MKEEYTLEQIEDITGILPQIVAENVLADCI